MLKLRHSFNPCLSEISAGGPIYTSYLPSTCELKAPNMTNYISTVNTFYEVQYGIDDCTNETKVLAASISYVLSSNFSGDVKFTLALLQNNMTSGVAINRV